MQVQPEFSLRILDDAFAKQNRTIAAIQVGSRAARGVMVTVSDECNSWSIVVFNVQLN